MVDESASDQAWDAGSMGCGELIIMLAVRMRAMVPATVLHLTATDPGAREDLPAWCRMTGHRLVRHEHPHYWIERRESP
ncbi:MAG: sulfurtransferase TusA family protein [Planctomycetaceae bacterium]|nr:sulfurtransferase TusA family protein [Planctomycetaceae bacterium]